MLTVLKHNIIMILFLSNQLHEDTGSDDACLNCLVSVAVCLSFQIPSLFNLQLRLALLLTLFMSHFICPSVCTGACTIGASVFAALGCVCRTIQTGGAAAVAHWQAGS